MTITLVIPNVLATIIAVVFVVLFLLRWKIVIWEDKRKRKKAIAKQRKALSKQQEQIVDGIMRVQGFCDLLNKSFSNNKERKRFWLEFATEPNKRQEIFDKLFKQFAPKPKIVVKKKEEAPKTTQEQAPKTPEQTQKPDETKTEEPKA
ncbi:MAG: hypothetical protein JW924_03180 [Fusobacteriaceae bacterium]|nr:hypothetical protein [Fusobacteriaceae bacterium]